MVSVSLESLVSVAGTRSVWPADFAAFVAKIEESPTDRTTWGVLADWLDEPERGERDMAYACRWVSKRPEVSLERRETYGHTITWSFSGLPKPVASIGITEYDQSTPAGAVAILAKQLRQLKEMVGD